MIYGEAECRIMALQPDLVSSGGIQHPASVGAVVIPRMANVEIVCRDAGWQVLWRRVIDATGELTKVRVP